MSEKWCNDCGTWGDHATFDHRVEALPLEHQWQVWDLDAGEYVRLDEFENEATCRVCHTCGGTKGCCKELPAGRKCPGIPIAEYREKLVEQRQRELRAWVRQETEDVYALTLKQPRRY